MILEAAISALLMVTATVALLKLAKTSSQLNQQSDQRMVLALATDNAAERMKVVPYDEIAREADRVAKTVAEHCNCQCEITSKSFETGSQKGIHLTITTRISDRVGRTQHRWVLDRQELDRPEANVSEENVAEEIDE